MNVSICNVYNSLQIQGATVQTVAVRDPEISGKEETETALGK